MEKWDYMRFVYETEALMAIGGIAAVTFNPYAPSVPDWADPSTATMPGQGGKSEENQPATTENTTGKDQEKIVMDGGEIIAPCWLINEFDGVDGWTEGGVWHTYTGETKLTRGPIDKFRIRYGWSFHGDGAWPDLYQGYVIEALDAEGRVTCWVDGWDGGPHCRAPNNAFPLDAKPCTGEQIPGDSSPYNANPGSTAWKRFEDQCLKPAYPDCGPWEEGGS